MSTCVADGEYKRIRTSSVEEEKNIQDFIEGTINYDCDVSFHPAPGSQVNLGSRVLLMGTEAELADTEQLKALPFWSDEVASIVSEAVEDAASGVFWTTIQPPAAEKKVRLAVAVINSVSSRHNCPSRPDLMIKAIKAFTLGGESIHMDIFVRSTNEVTVATSVARGLSGRSFSAKGGCAEKGYLNKTKPARVFFPTDSLTMKPEHLKVLANNTQVSMRLIDAPTNLLDTTTFPEIASALGKKMGFDFNILQGEELRELGYGGIYGVGKAAEFPPALVTLHYKPSAPSSKQKIALVGKGIVYDTGGLAIKYPATAMCTMKCDMGGSAVIFAGFISAVAMEADRELWCVLCLADNAIGPRAQRNDDIVRLKSGLTVEINNTDAEGRLVLSDGVYHASQFHPDVIIDMATLTGAQKIATGNHHAALYTDSEEWEKIMLAAGLRSGDLLMPIVYAPEFHNLEFSSKVADHTNSTLNMSNAATSCAGQFIKNNLTAGNFEGAFVHVDLAGPTFVEKQATGYGIGLLVDLLV